MDYNQRSRGQKSGVGHPARAPRRSVSSRMGLEKRGAPAQQPPRGNAPRPNQQRGPNQPPRSGQPPRQNRPGQNQSNNGRRPRPQQQINPQKSGYTPGSPRRQRRVTQAEILRRTRRRRFLGMLAVLAVLAIGAFVSVNLLFKVAIFRVENFDHSTPADTGIYTEDEIVSALNIEKNSNLFAFSTAEKTKELQAQFPYLDKVEVTVQMPATVVVRLTPATERFTCMYSGGWMVLSDALRILRALRFSARLGFALDEATAAAALQARDTLQSVSAERIYTEIDGLLGAPNAGPTLAKYGEILAGAVPEVQACIDCTQPGRWHCYDVWQHSAVAVEKLDLRGQDTRGARVLCWAAFLHDIAKPQCRSVGADGAAHFKGHNQRGAAMARTILRRLKAPGYLIEGTTGLIAIHDAPVPAGDTAILKSLNRYGAVFLHRLCALKYADLDAHADTPEVKARRNEVAAFEARMTELSKTACYTMRQLAVNGGDLMEAGLPAGPAVGATLQRLLTAVMEGRVLNERAALLEFALS